MAHRINVLRPEDWGDVRPQLEADRAESKPDGKEPIDPNRMNAETSEELRDNEQILREYEAHQRFAEGGPDPDLSSEFQGF